MKELVVVELLDEDVANDLVLDAEVVLELLKVGEEGGAAIEELVMIELIAGISELVLDKLVADVDKDLVLLRDDLI